MSDPSSGSGGRHDRSGSGSVSGVVAVVAAAGRGDRLGPRRDERGKALVAIDGDPLIRLAVTGLRRAGIDDIVVVHPPGQQEEFAAALDDDVLLVAGGRTRTDSVRAGFAAAPEEGELIAVHDAARPLVPPDVVRATVRAVREEVVAAAPALPVADTLKRVADGAVVATVDRTDLWAVQTPQVVRRDVFVVALDCANDVATDDLTLVERAIAAGIVTGRIVVVRGDRRGIKITGPDDLELVRALQRSAAPRSDVGARR